MKTTQDQRPVQQQSRSASKGQNSGKRRPRRTGKKPDNIIYTQPDTFNRKQFVLHLATMVAVVLALLFGMSLFFKVEQVTVAGVSKYTEWEIREASGIQDGDNLLTLSKSKISSRIYSRLPYVKYVRIGRELPNTVKIEVVELDVTYAVEAEEQQWWLIRADGMVVEQIDKLQSAQYTQILGLRLQNPEVAAQAIAVEPQPQETMPDGTTVPPTVKGEEQLTAALAIMQSLEENGIMGQVVSIDVSDPGDLQMWYEDRFRVLLGNSDRLPEKISQIATAVRDYMASYESGTLDVRQATQKEDGKTYEVIYKRFE